MLNISRNSGRMAVAAAIALSVVGAASAVARPQFDTEQKAREVAAAPTEGPEGIETFDAHDEHRRPTSTTTDTPPSTDPTPTTPDPTTPAPATPTPDPTVPTPTETATQAPTPSPSESPDLPDPSDPSAWSNLTGIQAPTAIPEAGVPEGIPLVARRDQHVTVPGTVIDGADINGRVVIDAWGVVIRNSRIRGDEGVGIYVNTGSVTIVDSTVVGFDDSIGGDNYIAHGVEVFGAHADGFKVGSNVLIEHSWCHDLLATGGAHSDCAQVQSGVVNTTIRGNWFDVGTGDANAALFIAPDLGPSSPGPLIAESNVLGGGNYTLFCLDGNDGDFHISDIILARNSFLRNSRYGALRTNVPAQIVDNVFQDTGESVR